MVVGHQGGKAFADLRLSVRLPERAEALLGRMETLLKERSAAKGSGIDRSSNEPHPQFYLGVNFTSTSRGLAVYGAEVTRMSAPARA